MTPFLDLEFGAYTYGQRVGRLEAADVRTLAAGAAIHHTEQILATARRVFIEA